MVEVKTELQKNAIADIRRQELETFQRALDIQWLNSRMEDGRMGRCLALIQREAQMEKDFQERTDHAAIVNAKAEKEAALGVEVAKVRREEDCLLLRRHYLRERDPSLRTLQKKLQAGYVCRDLRQQILHNEYRRLQEKSEDMNANNVLRKALYDDNEEAQRMDLKKLEETSKYRQELQQQLVNRQRQKQCQYEDTLIEKKMLDDIMKTIADEDQRELQQKRANTDRLRREMVASGRARAAWAGKQKALVILEEKQLEKQKQALSDRSAAVIAERQRRLREREETNAKIAAKILADQAERQEREEVIQNLQQQEYLERNVQEDAGERGKAERVKRETMEALSAQARARRGLRDDQVAREASFRKEVEAKIAADEEKEREKQRKLKQKNRDYSLELMKQIEQNQRRRQQERDSQENRARYVGQYHDAWQSEVNQERNKIIEEHVPHLLGYLQAGVIKKDDLPTVRAGANQHQDLAQLDIEAMAISNRPKRFSKCNAQCRILREY